MIFADEATQTAIVVIALAAVGIITVLLDAYYRRKHDLNREHRFVDACLRKWGGDSNQ